MNILTSWLKSRRVQYFAISTFSFWILFLVLRAIFYFGFSKLPIETDISFGEILSATSFGIRFDLRVAIIAAAPIALMLGLPYFNVFRFRTLRWILRAYIFALIVLLLTVYAFDFGFYQYLGVRLNASAFRFLEDGKISMNMVWESYPVIKIAIAVFLSALLFTWSMTGLERLTLDRNLKDISLPSKLIGSLFLITFVFFGLIGRVSNVNLSNPTPIRWGDVYLMGNSHLVAFGLNPVTFLYETSRSSKDTYDIKLVKDYYGIVSNYLSVDPKIEDPAPVFARTIPASSKEHSGDSSPNIVFVMLESLGASRLGLYGNPLTPTPALDAIGKDSWWLTHLFVPRPSTAKTVWASFTGIPDVSYGKSATRNPLITKQTLALNYLDNYNKIYAIGGNAGWANIKALVSGSVNNVQIFEEGYWKSPNVDVWGISDLSLFKEADQIIRSLPKNKPFFAYIQTAGNHEPFTIPNEDSGFSVVNPSEEALYSAGFRNARQFNAVRLLDFSVGRFMDMAKKGGYFDNTIFVFFGDHNNVITTVPFMPSAYEKLNLESNYVPGFIYAPKLLKPMKFSEAASLMDLMPTVLSLTGRKYVNTTMGRDIKKPAPEGVRAVPIMSGEGKQAKIGVVTKDYYLQMNVDGADVKLHDLKSDKPLNDVSSEHAEEFDRLSNLARGLHESARYMMYKNVVK